MAELKWIEDFIDLSTTRSFSLTAENRFVTQPALSRRIKQLEDWFGATLVQRNGRKPISLTDEGSAFLPMARDMVDSLLKVRQTVIARVAQKPAWATMSVLDEPTNDQTTTLNGQLSLPARSEVHQPSDAEAEAEHSVLIVDASKVVLSVLAKSVGSVG